MLYAKLASLSPLLLTLLQQSGKAEPPPKLILFFLFAAFSALFAVLTVLFVTSCFGVFAVPLVSGVRWLYGRSVLRWMSVPGGAAPPAEGPPAGPPARPPANRDLRIELHYSQAPQGPEACPLSRRADEASRALSRVYLAAAVAYAAAVTPTAAHLGFYLKAHPPEGADFSPLGPASPFLGAFAVLLWLPVLTYVAVPVSRWWRKLFAVAAYALLISSPVLLLSPEGTQAVMTLILVMWFFLMTAPTSTMLVLRFSGVGGLALAMIFTFTAPAVMAVIKLLTLGEQTAPAGDDISLAEFATLLASLWLLAAVTVVAVVAASGFVWWMSRRYAGKKTSEQIFLLDVFWLFTTFIICLAAYFSSAGWYTALGPLAFGLHKLVVWAGLRRIERGRGRGGELRLLLLRVFGAKRRSEWLLKRLRHYWLYSGSIQLIAAPDLAGVNLELDELLDFLRGRLRNRFVKDTRDSARRVESLDVRPDPDGRYRVNEFFCHDDVWAETVAALARRSDAVLMDLRGFTRANRGCVHELYRLVDTVPVNRLVITVNEQTDLDYLRATFADAWAGMGARSPNRDLPAPVLRLLHVTMQNSRAVRRLLYMLCEAAQVPRPPAGVAGRVA